MGSTFGSGGGEQPAARSGNGAGPPPQPTGDVLIELHDVSKAFGKKDILKGTTLKIRRGEAVGIIGALVQDAAELCIGLSDIRLTRISVPGSLQTLSRCLQPASSSNCFDRFPLGES